jgi:hypothetical protein
MLRGSSSTATRSRKNSEGNGGQIPIKSPYRETKEGVMRCYSNRLKTRMRGVILA